MYQVMLTEKGKLELDKWDKILLEGKEFTEEDDFQIITPLALAAGKMNAFMTVTTESISMEEFIQGIKKEMEYKCGYVCDGSKLDPDWFSFIELQSCQSEVTTFEDVANAFKVAYSEYNRILSSMTYLYDFNNLDISVLTELIDRARLKVSKLSGKELAQFNKIKSEYDYVIALIDEFLNTIVHLKKMT
ncbi:hypothetical protein [Paenibacillus taichungensis]|uniref:hypothetical protein n=1 Tax=Paenibacillus taichungensis TaxID=484184 RepID=UPI0039A23312